MLSLWLVRPWMSSDRRLELSHGVAPQTPATQPPRTPLCSPSTQQDRGPRWPPPPLLHSGKFLRAAGHGPSEAPCVRASKATAPASDGTVSQLRRHARATRAVRHPAALANLGAERPSRRGMSPWSTRGHRFRPGVPSPSPGRSDSFSSPASGDCCTHSSSCLLVKTLLLIKSRFRRVCTQGRERGVTGSRGVCPAVSGPPSGLVGQQTHFAPHGLSDIESPVPLLFLTRLLAGCHSADSWHRGLVSRTDTRTRRPRSAGSGVWPIFSPSASPLFKGLGVRGLSPARGDTLQNRPPRGPTLRQRSLRRTRP